LSLPVSCIFSRQQMADFVFSSNPPSLCLLIGELRLSTFRIIICSNFWHFVGFVTFDSSLLVCLSTHLLIFILSCVFIVAFLFFFWV
jgi:hypothetical protein